MSIQKISQNITSSFLRNKTVLKTLEKISEHGTSFSAGTSLVLSLGLRPLAINSTPNVEKENKQYAMANSIGSGLMKFAMVEAVALPIENAVKKIDKNPQKFLKLSTIKHLAMDKNLTDVKSYKLITQMVKLGAGFITAVPKSVLTIALIPVIMDNLFKNKLKNNVDNSNPATINKGKDVSFGGLGTGLSKGIAKIIDNRPLQDFALKYQNHDKDIAKHMTAATDILLTTTSVYQTSKSKGIEENRKKVLMYNHIISTAITLVGGYSVDSLFKKKTDKFIEYFKKLNANDTKLYKYVEGINIIRPALIFAGIYYCILPIFSTYMSEKIDKFVNRENVIR